MKLLSVNKQLYLINAMKLLAERQIYILYLKSLTALQN